MEFILERGKKLWISYGAEYVGKFCYGFLCGLNHFINRAAMGRARFLIYPWFIFFLSVG